VTTRLPEFTPIEAPAPGQANRWWRWGLIALAVAVLYVVYWRESWSTSASSDSASTALQAWDVLHGNLLLHGWWMSDVSFYTTEVPQYVLLEAVGGLGPWVVHAAAAMTYTLIVVLVALLAKGSAGRDSAGRDSAGRDGATGREGWTRALLAGLIAASPQASAAYMLLLGPDHTGTVVPVLAAWLLIDLVRPRWYIPVIVGVLLTWIMVADSVVLFTAIAPLIVAAVVRAFRRDHAAQRRYELGLAAAAAAAGVLGTLIPRLIVHLGGYRISPVSFTAMPLGALRHDAWNTIQAVLELFGADPFGGYPLTERVLCVFHFAGVLLALAALCLALRRFLREDGVLVPALALAILVEVASFLFSTHAENLASIREIVAVMPLGAVLAGRLMARPLLAAGSWLASLRSASLRSASLRSASLRSASLRLRGFTLGGPARLRVVAAAGLASLIGASLIGAGLIVAGLIVAGYVAAMEYGAAQPSVPSNDLPLASWLVAHRLTDGLAPYWQAGISTLDAGGKVRVSAVTIHNGRLAPYNWETDTADYGRHFRNAKFVVTGGKTLGPLPGLAAAATRTLGPPAHIYHDGPYTILTW
jgi:hypothetical protein